MSRRLLFHRDFRRASGGHGKVWDYFEHARSHADWSASVYLTPASVEPDNPWRAHAVPVQPQWRPEQSDALLLGGMDWQAWPHDDPARPVINLVQGVRHGDPGDPRHAFLGRRAIRLCVSAPVAEAILASGRVNGPVRVIEAALRLPDGLAAPETRAGVFIDATKQPSLGRALAAALCGRGCQVALCDRRVLRHEYLAQMAAAAIAVTLPYATEGFYLPGLEAMALGCATIVPDCIGNRAYLADGRNALAPPLQLDALLQAVQRLDDAALFARLVTHGRETAARFGLQREREAFHAVLDDIDHLWNA